MMRLSDSDLEALTPSLRPFGARARVSQSHGNKGFAPDQASPESYPASPLAHPFPIADQLLISPSDSHSEKVDPTQSKTEGTTKPEAEIPSSQSTPVDQVDKPSHLAPSSSLDPSDTGISNESQLMSHPQPDGLAESSVLEAANGNGQRQLPSLVGDATPEVEIERGFLPVLKNRNFLTLWSGQVFSQLADKVYLVLMIALIANRFQGADQTISGWVSSIMIAFTIPAVLFGSIAGVFVDRWFKKPVLVATNLLRGGLVLILPPLLWISQGWSPLGPLPIGFCILLLITFLVSTLTQFFAPAEQSAIPLIVDRRHLLSANSLYTTTMMASVIIGFAVGEPILGLADALVAQLGGAFGIGKELVVGGSYAIAGLILLLLRTDEKMTRVQEAASKDSPEEPPHVLQDIRDGIRYLREQDQVRCALIQLVILFSVFAALAVLAVRLAEIIPEIKASQFGFLLAAGGVGMACGAAIVGQFGQRFSHAQLSLYGSLGMAASLVGLSVFSHRLLPTLALIALLGSFAAIVGVPMQTTIQEETPEEMRGKVFGLQNNAINIALSLPLALAGVAETFFGLQAVFLGLAILVITGGLLTWYISRTGTATTNSEQSP